MIPATAMPGKSCPQAYRHHIAVTLPAGSIPRMARIVDGWRVEATEPAPRRNPVADPDVEGLPASDGSGDGQLDDVEAQDYGFSPPEALEGACERSS